MFDKEFDIATLISLYQKGEIDINSRQRLEAWLAADPINQNLLEELSQDNELQSKFAKFRAFDEILGWEKVMDGIPEISQNTQAVKRIPLWPRYFLVAAIAAIVFGAGLFYYNGIKDKEPVTHVYGNDVAPGTLGATLTLASGKKISLRDADKGELANESGISISKTADGQVVYEAKVKEGISNKINTLSTAKGETYILTLPDKSTVWMNATSSITYSATLLERGVRRVKLEGEAYFEVAKDRLHPFVVQAGRQHVEVLGTHFNINSYSDEPVTATTLLEGSVRVSADGNEKILRPGQAAKLGAKGLEVSEANLAVVTAWRDGRMLFRQTDIQSVLRQISRWYNVEIEYQGKVPDYTITGEVSRGESFSSILKLLELSEVNFELKGRKLVILP